MRSPGCVPMARDLGSRCLSHTPQCEKEKDIFEKWRMDAVEPNSLSVRKEMGQATKREAEQGQI